MNRAAPKRPRRNGPPSNVYRRTDAAKQGARLNPSAAADRPSREVRAGVPSRRGQAAETSSQVDCALKAICGACQFVNTTYNTGLQQKYHLGIAALKKAGVIEKAKLLPPAEAPKPLEYRSLFKLAVRHVPLPLTVRPGEVPERFAIGLFQPGTHRIVSMDDCPLHTPPLQRLIRDLKWELNKTTLTGYNEREHSGQLRYIAARAAHLTGEIILTFVLNATYNEDESPAEKGELKRLVDTLRRKNHKVNSAHINFNPEKGNAIFGRHTQRIAGSDRLRERLCDLNFEVGPTSFFQINPWQAINLYRRVEQVAGLATVGSGKTTSVPVAWDLYCGTGQISLILARAGYHVLGIEENPDAVSDAKANAKKNRLENKADFLAARVEDSQDILPPWAKNPSLFVVNPSRRGLAESTRIHLARLLEQNPLSRFVYVSCEVDTLARDLKELIESGFTVRQIEPFDMFPQTDKMEWLAVLTK